MKKIIPCLILLFLTGCTAEYRVNITKKSIDDMNHLGTTSIKKDIV